MGQQCFQGWISKDINSVYYIDKKVVTADPATFTITEDVPITKDSNNVFLYFKKIPNANPKTYNVVYNLGTDRPGNVYGRDAVQCYLDYDEIDCATMPKSFDDALKVSSTLKQTSVASTTTVTESVSGLRMYFNSDPEISDQLMTGVLNIALKDTSATKTIDVTGYSLKSTKTGEIFTLNKMALSGSKYKECSPIPTGPASVRFDEGMGNIITIIANSSAADCQHEAEGLVIYSLHSTGSLWNTTGDTLELRNLEGSVVASYTF